MIVVAVVVVAAVMVDVVVVAVVALIALVSAVVVVVVVVVAVHWHYVSRHWRKACVHIRARITRHVVIYTSSRDIRLLMKIVMCVRGG